MGDDATKILVDVKGAHPCTSSNLSRCQHGVMDRKQPRESKCLHTVAKSLRGKYSAQAAHENCSILTAGFESHGRVGQEFLQLIAKLAQQTAANDMCPDMSIKKYQQKMMEELSVAIQRGNGIAMIAHMRDA